MPRSLRLMMAILLSALLVGCSQNRAVRPGSEALDPSPSMPPLAPIGQSHPPAPVFGPPETFHGSPLPHVGRGGLFATHRPKANRLALLKNGEASFAARVHPLEEARKSIRIQALVFSGDEAGLYIAEILKRKKAEGLDVRVIVDAPSNLGFQTQWMYFDLKKDPSDALYKLRKEFGALFEPLL